MRTNVRYIAMLLAAGAAALAIGAAPSAAAASADQSCIGTGSGTVCQSPGNVQINDEPPSVGYSPYGDDAFLLGGFGDGFHGGGHR